jgi:predicted N-acetyltransferase YhbS
MATIRPFERSDLPSVSRLLRANIESWWRDDEFLSGTLLDHPWVDDELRSLVATEDGEVTGFVGAQARRMVFDDRPVRGVCVSHLAVAPGKRAGAAGALLLSRLLAGPQDLSWSDSANAAVVRMWRTFGGDVDSARASDWMIVVRPVRWVAGAARNVVRRRRVGRQEVPVGALPAHMGRGIGEPEAEEPAFDALSEPVSIEVIAEEEPAAARGVRLRIAHDPAYLDHVFGLIEREGVPVVRRLVRRGGRIVGWYAYLRRPDGARRVLHFSASTRDREAVFERLVEDARADGGTVLSGRFEPGLEEPLAARMAVLGLARKPMLHTGDAEIRAVIQTESALITQLDSEWFVT